MTSFAATEWKLNYNYWTAGIKNNCNSSFSWCSGNFSQIVQLTDDLIWEKGQPDNFGGNETCVHLRIPRNASDGVKLTDKNCANKFIAACEVRVLIYLKFLRLLLFGFI